MSDKTKITKTIKINKIVVGWDLIVERLYLRNKIDDAKLADYVKAGLVTAEIESKIKEEKLKNDEKKDKK